MDREVNNHAVRVIFKSQEGLEASPGYLKCKERLTKYENDIVAFQYGLAQDRASLKGFGRLKFPLWAINHFILNKYVIPIHRAKMVKIKEAMELPVGFSVAFLMEELDKYEETNKKVFEAITRQYRRNVLKEEI